MQKNALNLYRDKIYVKQPTSSQGQFLWLHNSFRNDTLGNLYCIEIYILLIACGTTSLQRIPLSHLFLKVIFNGLMSRSLCKSVLRR